MANLAQSPVRKQLKSFPVKFATSVFFGEYSSTTLAFKDSLSEALAAGFREATYYLGHHQATRIKVSAVCEKCYGESFISIRGPRTVKRKTCPNCRGHVGDLETIEFDAVPNESVRVIDNGTGMCIQR